MKRLVLLLGSVGVALASTASAQSFNIDVGLFSGTPAATFGAGADQPGAWNSVPGNPGTWPLVGLNGLATTASITCVGAGSNGSWTDDPLTSGEDERLMDDYSITVALSGSTWTISGLAPGDYILYTYAWSPYSTGPSSTVDVGGSLDGAQNVGGAWPGTYTQSVTHAMHHITVAPDGSIVMHLQPWVVWATLNGFQLVLDSPAIQHCDPNTGSVIACPCGNPPASGWRGCDNSSFTGGASISATGFADLLIDTLVFTTVGEKPTATSILLQGSSLLPAGTVFGQGVRCFTGLLKRLYLATASGGSISVPPPGFQPISSRSASLGDPIAHGTSRFYLVYYRDPIVLGGCSATSTFNATNTVEIVWQ